MRTMLPMSCFGPVPYLAPARKMSPSSWNTPMSPASQRRAAFAATASRTGCTSVGERLMVRRISLVAVCCSSESARAFSRASTLASSAAFVTCVMDTLLRQGAGPGALSSRQSPHLRLRLLQPVRHPHLAVQRRRGREMLSGLLALARAPIESAEAEVGVGDERAHAARRGEGQRLAVVGLTALGIEPVGMGRDVAEEVLRISRKPVVSGRGFESAVGQTPRLAEPTEQQTSATQRVVGPAAIADDSPSREALEELLALTEPVQRRAPLTELRQYPGGGADRPGKQEDDVPRSDHRDPVLDHRARLRPVALEEVERARGPVGHPGGGRMMRRLGE